MQHENVYFMRWELLLRGKTKGFSFNIIPINVILMSRLFFFGRAFDYYIGTPLPKVLQALWEI